MKISFSFRSLAGLHCAKKEWKEKVSERESKINFLFCSVRKGEIVQNGC